MSVSGAHAVAQIKKLFHDGKASRNEPDFALLQIHHFG
jgi:hypothetical protein